MIALPSFIPSRLVALGAAGSLLLAAGLGTGLVLTRAKLETVKGSYGEFIQKVNANTAKWESLGLVRLISSQRKQIDATNKSLAAAQARADRATARWNGLRAKYTDASGRRLEPLPAIPSPTGGFSQDPARPGFFTILASDAVTLMQNCDGWVEAFDDLVKWNHDQASITIELDEPK